MDVGIRNKPFCKKLYQKHQERNGGDVGIRTQISRSHLETTGRCYLVIAFAHRSITGAPHSARLYYAPDEENLGRRAYKKLSLWKCRRKEKKKPHYSIKGKRKFSDELIFPKNNWITLVSLDKESHPLIKTRA